ncbi:hypothetical protein LQG66_28260 [Bradyrhizobium ontarionense]|uniref:Uncharacterized protein n=1 Tax=Bradyrhizobium ontarionense TaxID=2898149 RepID=A0ABY3RPV2_9BRAD|nr:hypothetical protein [Bradyrhizobium sp. A19]UFZ08655.1 hypothetical protein LQG66_28260 [Bradyrhizobium sp. A19]
MRDVAWYVSGQVGQPDAIAFEPERPNGARSGSRPEAFSHLLRGSAPRTELNLSTSPTDLLQGQGKVEVATIMAKVFSRAFSESSDGTKDALLKHLVLFCASGLFVLMLALSYGIDLSPGFF